MLQLHPGRHPRLHNRHFSHHGRLERLIKQDLAHARKPRACAAKAPVEGHREWFVVSRETALATVQQWERFMQHETPYSWTGNLSIVWSYVLEQRSPHPHSLATQHLSHQCRREHWAAILAPPTFGEWWNAYWAYASMLLRVTRNCAAKICACVYMFFWQIVVVLYGLYTLFLCQTRGALAVFILVLGCASVTVLVRVPPHDSQGKRLWTPPRATA